MRRAVKIPSLSRGVARALPTSSAAAPAALTHAVSAVFGAQPVAQMSAAAAPAGAAKKDALKMTDEFAPRHIGPRERDVPHMLAAIAGGKYKTLDELVSATVPDKIKLERDLDVCEALTESEALKTIKAMADANVVGKSYLGAGYYGTHTPSCVQRNILENPGWYTSYTPYQAEISQGRLESLLNFQTMVVDLTGMAISNASLLDESTAAAEAMQMTFSTTNNKRKGFLVASDVHPQTIATIKTRASGLGIDVVVADPSALKGHLESKEFAGVLVQYPNTYGSLSNGSSGGATHKELVEAAKASGTMTVAATDLLALTLIKSPGELGFDIAIGSAQRFGVPMGFGGPHAAFLATKDEHKRKMPGRIMGVSVDSNGKRALRMAMQTREQHIRRDKATSNICTAQALLANMAAMYGVYHGPEGLKRIAMRTHSMAQEFAAALAEAGYKVEGGNARFDTVTVAVPDVVSLKDKAMSRDILLRFHDEGMDAMLKKPTTDFSGRVSVAFDETTTADDLRALASVFGLSPSIDWSGRVTRRAEAGAAASIGSEHARTSAFMTHPVFNSHHSEAQLTRYIHKLQSKDISLTHSMISLGSCTMKLNAASELMPVSFEGFANVHPWAPDAHTVGYRRLISTLSHALCKITGFAAMSMQPNSGAAGEYAGLMAIRSYHESRGQGHRNVCLIPISAHGTNPASAVMAGYKVVVVNSDADGNVDFSDLKAKAEANKENLAALMVTYPSTYGVFEEGIKDIIDTVHGYGGQVYMDGANMNAQVGLTSPGHIGADVCHLNLHKTFAIPHGGGGPGVGSIGVAKHLAPFLPGHPVVPTGGDGKAVVPKSDLTVAAAPYGSALILPISWMYIHMLGSEGLKRATQYAILNANYLAAKLSPHFPIAFKAKDTGLCAHEFIIDLRPFKAKTNNAISEEDVAKRLQDYGFHSPTMSWPVSGTLMIEPTESEDLAELDRFADALISIKGEIDDVISGKSDPKNNPLKNAPHTAAVVTASKWDRPYTREQAAYPREWVRENKFWPSVGRVDNVHGDRVLVCACEPVENYK